MNRVFIDSGSDFEKKIGYSRVGDWVFVSGTTGFDYAAVSISGCRAVGPSDERMKIEIEVTALKGARQGSHPGNNP